MKELKKITPVFNGVLTTMKKLEEVQCIEGTDIIDPNKSSNNIDIYQMVVSIGNAVRNVKEGDIVRINPKRYAIKKQVKKNVSQEVEGYSEEIVGYDFNIVSIEGENHLLIYDSDIEFIVNEFANSL